MDHEDVEATTKGHEHIPRQLRRGISWNLVGAIATNLMRLLVVVVLGRLLDSHDFGVVAAAISVIAILHTVRDVGIGPALVQRKELAPGHVGTAFAVSTYLGVVLAGLVVVTAPLVARLYHSPECTALLRALGMIFVLRGISTTSQMLCHREMNFRAIALIDTVSYAAGSVASIVLAALGLGPWSLAIGYLIEETMGGIAYLVLYRPRFTLRINRARLGELLGFGAGQTIFRVVNIVATQGDNVVVGHELGPDPLGFYTRAYDLLKLPAAVFTNIVGNVLFPAFSRLQDDPERLGIGFRRVIFATTLILLPASAVLIAVAPEAIRILLGPHWDEAVLPFQIMSVTMLLRVSYKGGVLVAQAAGRVYALAAVNLVYAACVIGGALVTVRWGIVGVASSTAISIGVMYLLCSQIGMQQSTLRWRGFGAAHVPGLLLTVLVGACTWPAAVALRAAGSPAAVTVAVVSVIAALVAVVALVPWVRRGQGDFSWLRSEVAVVKAKLLRRPAVAAAKAPEPPEA